MTTATATPARRSLGYLTTEVEIDLDDLAADLEEAGWHQEEDCPAKIPARPVTSMTELAGAVGSLHRQAHPSQPADPFLCREEPCRSLPADVTLTRLSTR